MDTTPIPPLSEDTTAAIGDLIDYSIQHEYGVAGAENSANGATIIALAGLHFDLHNQFVSMNGTADGLDGYAQATLRILIRNGLEARRCQCHRLTGTCPHGIDAHCSNHYESDVPPIGGALLCGRCHIAEYQAGRKEGTR